MCNIKIHTKSNASDDYLRYIRLNMSIFRTFNLIGFLIYSKLITSCLLKQIVCKEMIRGMGKIQVLKELHTSIRPDPISVMIIL